MAEHRFHTPLPLELHVKIPHGTIDVETVDGDESVVVVAGDQKLVDQTEVSLDGNRLTVGFRGKRPFGITIAIGSFTIGGEGLRIRASVPHGADASFGSASADVTVDGRLHDVDVNTASGDLRLRGEVERDAVVKTVSGDARIERVGGDVRVQTVSGDADVGWVGGSVEAKTVSGDVRVDSLHEGSANFTSVSGDVEFGIAPGTFLDVDAGSVSGDLSSEVPLGSLPDDHHGDGGPTVVLRGRTVSGDVKVFRALA